MRLSAAFAACQRALRHHACLQASGESAALAAFTSVCGTCHKAARWAAKRVSAQSFSERLNQGSK
eukprot:15442050-Alexandrium_andersonii.AAC.1